MSEAVIVTAHNNVLTQADGLKMWTRRGAEMSADGTRRYLLWRTMRDILWDMSRTVTFVMLNPSTADDHVDDPTIRRCMRFAKDLEFARLFVVNLSPLRATDPDALLRAADPYSDQVADGWVRMALGVASTIICAWGAHPAADMLLDHSGHLFAGRQLHCLGLTKGGSPRHPLYLRANAQPIIWREP